MSTSISTNTVQFKKYIDSMKRQVHALLGVVESEIKLLDQGKKDEFIKKSALNQNKYNTELKLIIDIHENILVSIKNDDNILNMFRKEIENVSSLYKKLVKKINLIDCHMEAYIRNHNIAVDVIKKEIVEMIKHENPYDNDGKLLPTHEIKKRMPAMYMTEGF